MAFQHPYAARNQHKLSASIAKQVASVIPKVATHLQSLQPQTSANHQSSTPTRHQIRVAALLTREVADAVATVVTRLQTIQPQASANRQSSTPTCNQIGIAALITREVANAISTVSIQTPATTSSRALKRSRNNKKRRNGTYPRCNRCNFHHANDSPCRFCTICGSYNHYPVKCRLCTNCGRYGHDTAKCHLCTNCGRYGHLVNRCHAQATQQPTAMPATQQTQSQYSLRACTVCGDPTHYRNACPKCWEAINSNTGFGNTIDTQTQANQ